MSDLTTTFTNIANAIRSKTGSSDTMTPSEMPNEIAGIETPMDSINITQNGTYEPSEGRGYNQVIVEVPESTLITKSITANGTYTASDDNADGYSQVTVAVEGFKKKSIANTPTDIASFNDGTANPMPSLEISIEPVQDLHGYENPWPAGGGKNKVDETAIRSKFLLDAPLITNTEITASVKATSDTTNITIRVWNADESQTDYWSLYQKIGEMYYRTLTLPFDVYKVVFNANGTISECQLELGNQPTSFAPYSNICPISGHTEADVTKCGVNLFDKDSTTVSNVTFEGPSGTTTRNGFELTLPNGNYSLKCFGATAQDYIYVYKNNAGNYIDVYYLSRAEGWENANISVDTGDKLYVVAAYTGRTLDLNFDLDIIAGTTPPTTYSPYQGSTTSIPFKDSQGNPVEVYGGSVDVVNGGGSATDDVVTFSDLTGWGKSQTVNRFQVPLTNVSRFPDLYTGGTADISCEIYKTVGGDDGYMGTYDYAISGSYWNGTNFLQINDTRFNTIEDLLSAIGSYKIRFKKATQTTFYTQPTAITPLDGDNNLQVDCGQVLEGEYFVTL